MLIFAASTRADKHSVLSIPYILGLVFLVLETTKNKSPPSSLCNSSTAFTTAPQTSFWHVEKSRAWQACLVTVAKLWPSTIHQSKYMHRKITNQPNYCTCKENTQKKSLLGILQWFIITLPWSLGTHKGQIKTRISWLLVPMGQSPKALDPTECKRWHLFIRLSLPGKCPF